MKDQERTRMTTRPSSSCGQRTTHNKLHIIPSPHITICSPHITYYPTIFTDDARITHQKFVHTSGDEPNATHRSSHNSQEQASNVTAAQTQLLPTFWGHERRSTRGARQRKHVTTLSKGTAAAVVLRLQDATLARKRKEKKNEYQRVREPQSNARQELYRAKRLAATQRRGHRMPTARFTSLSLSLSLCVCVCVWSFAVSMLLLRSEKHDVFFRDACATQRAGAEDLGALRTGGHVHARECHLRASADADNKVKHGRSKWVRSRRSPVQGQVVCDVSIDEKPLARISGTSRDGS